VNAALQPPAETPWAEVFRRELALVRSRHDLYPPAAALPSVSLEKASHTVRAVAANCLPLGVAIVMHLYPLCALQCAPLATLSLAGFKRGLLMRAIRSRSLLVANGGSERSQGAHAPLTVISQGDSLRVRGTFDYVSLASVADLVLFSAPLADGTAQVFCAAHLSQPSVQIGESRFSGRMQLADTRSLTFVDHELPRGRHLRIHDERRERCLFDYQRSWFHLLLADAYLARIERLQQDWALPYAAEHRLQLDEVACLRRFAAQLLDQCGSGGRGTELLHVTGIIKLRVSSMAQATGDLLRARRALEDADELRYMRLQPTADSQLIASLPFGATSANNCSASMGSKR